MCRSPKRQLKREKQRRRLSKENTENLKLSSLAKERNHSTLKKVEGMGLTEGLNVPASILL